MASSSKEHANSLATSLELYRSISSANENPANLWIREAHNSNVLFISYHTANREYKPRLEEETFTLAGAERSITVNKSSQAKQWRNFTELSHDFETLKLPCNTIAELTKSWSNRRSNADRTTITWSGKVCRAAAKGLRTKEEWKILGFGQCFISPMHGPSVTTSVQI